MSEVIYITFFVFIGYSLTASGILPYSISPFFSLSALPVFATLTPSAGLFTAIFVAGLIHDSIMGLPPGTTPLFLLLLYPALRILHTNFYLTGKSALTFSALAATSVYALFLIILPGKFPYTLQDFALKVIFTPLWAVVISVVVDKIKLHKEERYRL